MNTRLAIVNYIRRPYLDELGELAVQRVSVDLMKEAGVLIVDKREEEVREVLDNDEVRAQHGNLYDLSKELNQRYTTELVKHYKKHPHLLFVSDYALASLIEHISISHWHKGSELQEVGAVHMFYTGKHQGRLINAQSENWWNIDGDTYNRLGVAQYKQIALVVANRLYKKYDTFFEKVSYERWLGDYKYYKYLSLEDTKIRGEAIFTKDRLALNIQNLILTYRHEMQEDEQGLRLLEGLTHLHEGLMGKYELQELEERHTYDLSQQCVPPTTSLFKPMDDEERRDFRYRQGMRTSTHYDSFKRYNRMMNQELLKERKLRKEKGLNKS